MRDLSASRVASRWLQRQAEITVEFFREKGFAVLHGQGSLQEVARALGQSVVKRMPGPGSVPKLRGAVRAFSFHWSNAQATWSVISVREFPWGIDGAEFILFVGQDTQSPLGKVWTLPEMQHVAKMLPNHPGYADSAERVIRAGQTLKHPTTIEVVCEDGEGAQAVINVLSYLQWCGNVGHSCGLKDDNLSICFFDGDGSDYIQSVKKDGKKAKSDKEWR